MQFPLGQCSLKSPYTHNRHSNSYRVRVLFLCEQRALSLSHVEGPLAFVPFAAAAIYDLAVPMFLALHEVALVDRAIRLGLLALACDLPVVKGAFVARTVSHQQNTLAVLHALHVVALVLEKRVLVGVHALTFAELGDRVQVAYVTLNNG